MRKSLPLFALVVMAMAAFASGCGDENPTPIDPEEAKKIVGEDPDYLPGPGASKKPAAKKH